MASRCGGRWLNALYLGYRVFPHHRWLLPRTCQTFKARLAWFNHKLTPDKQPHALAPQRGKWSHPDEWPESIDASVLRSVLATLNSYYGLLAQGNHLRLRQQFYHQHLGALKRYFIPGDSQYSHLKIKQVWQEPGQHWPP